MAVGTVGCYSSRDRYKPIVRTGFFLRQYVRQSSSVAGWARAGPPRSRQDDLCDPPCVAPERSLRSARSRVTGRRTSSGGLRQGRRGEIGSAVRAPREAKRAAAAPYREIERHVHFEATVRPGLLIEIARRNGVELPAATVEGLRQCYRVESLRQFVARRIATSRAPCVDDGTKASAREVAARQPSATATLPTSRRASRAPVPEPRAIL